MTTDERSHMPRDAEQIAFMNYVAAIGRTVGHDASANAARKACPQEFQEWREAFIAVVGYDPA